MTTRSDTVAVADAPERESRQDFYIRYVQRHRSPATRWAHVIGTLTGTLVALWGATHRRPKLIAGLPLIRYSVAWSTHLFVERNRPMTTWLHVVRYLVADFRMMAVMLTGRDAKLARIAATDTPDRPELTD